MGVVWFFFLVALVRSAPSNQIQEDYELLARQVALQQPCPPDVHAVLREMAASLAEQKVKISDLEKDNEDYNEKGKELERLKAEIDKLKQQLEVKQVVFSASLLAHGHAILGPYTTFTTLVFKRIVTNIGNAYNPHTGIFTAPVRGVYHFEWYIGAGGGEHASAASLMKNGDIIYTAWEHQSSLHGTSSNGAALLLEVGDQVYVRQFTNTVMFDSTIHHTSFSGFLLFTM